MATIFVLNQDTPYHTREGHELLQAYKLNPKLPLKFGCCQGKCGVCVIKVIEGNQNLSKCTKQEIETLKKRGLNSPPFRLACQCAIQGDITIEKP